MTAERFFLAHYTSSITVAYYAVANTLGTLLLIVPSAVVQPLLPALTRLSSQGRTDEHRQLYHQALRGVFLLVVPVALAVAFLASPFLTLWAGHSYGVHSAGPLYIVLAGVCALTLSWVPFSQMLAAGQTRLLAQIHLAELGPYLVLAAVLTSAHGAIGAAVAWSTRCVADAAIYFAVTHRVYRLPVTPTPRRAVSFLIAVALLAAAFLGLAALTHSLVFRAASATVVLVAFAAGTWRIVLTPQEQTGLGAVAGQVIPPKLRSWVGRPAAGAHNQF
jgi:O-antigen/teichoic acid export membrane protein